MGESGPKRKKNVSVRGREGQSYNSKWDGITWDQKVGAIIPGPAPGVCHVVGVATPDPGGAPDPVVLPGLTGGSWHPGRGLKNHGCSLVRSSLI